MGGLEGFYSFVEVSGNFLSSFLVLGSLILNGTKSDEVNNSAHE